MGMEEHLKLLAVLLIVMAVVGFIGAIVFIAVVGSPIAMIVDAGLDGTAESITEPMMRLFGAALSLLLFLMAIPTFLTGLGLLRFQPWARDAGMVVCALHLLVLPVGTLLGIYGFWVLLSPESEPLFSPRPSR